MTTSTSPIHWLAALLLLLSACQNDPTPDENLVRVFTEHETLSDYGFFHGELNQMQPTEQVIPYELNTSLFTDYAFKARFVYVPEGAKAEYHDTEVMQLPVGSVLIKTFYYPEDFREPDGPRRIIETRLLVHEDQGWVARNYKWNDEQTEAYRDIAGGTVGGVMWTHYDGESRSTNYRIPNNNECKGCHEYDGVLTPIGPKARNLNKDYDYADGTYNQLTYWTNQGILSGAPDPAAAPRLPDAFDATDGTLERRARAYLDINCGHCHNPLGPANNSGLSLYSTETNMSALGVCKRPVAAGSGSGGLQFSIVPGDPDRSIIVYRMSNDTDGDVMMPELGRSTNHEEGIALIREWIANMDAAPCN